MKARSRQCQHKSQCYRDATWGLYTWKPGETTVNPQTPLRVYCGQHKPKVDSQVRARILRLA